MATPDPQEVMQNARRLRDERFALRNLNLQQRASERFNLTVIDVPAAYRKTSLQTTNDGKVRPSSNIISDEGRQVATLVYALPVPHLAPPQPEDQPATTKVEQFLIAMQQELEESYGPVWWQCTSAQVHDNLGWVFFAPKRKPYKGAPKAPDEDADADELAAYGTKTERYKKDAGIAAYFDYEFATTETVLHEGNVFNPKCLYVWKEVPVASFKKTYGEMENVTGRPEGRTSREATITVVEYWDAEECVIVCETTDTKWLGTREVKGTHVLDSWTHNWGRVPYFARPCFVTEQLDEDKKFEGPLDGIYNEMPYHKRLMAMVASVSYQTAFAPLIIETKEAGELIMDDSGDAAATFIELEPAMARQLRPGQSISPLQQSPEVKNLFMEFAQSSQRLERFMLSPVAKGVSPGADTANAALSNLHRFQLSALQPMSEQASRQARAIFRFALERIKEDGETVYAFNRATDSYHGIADADIVSVNVQAKSTPDQGQFQLLIEKHVMELWMAGFITEQEAHEMRGKEAPEEYVKANMVERLRKQLEPVILHQIVTDLGMLDAVNQMIQANAQTGSARSAIPALEQQASQLDNPSGMGSGAPGQPRGAGVRMPSTDVNTQEAQVVGAP